MSMDYHFLCPFQSICTTSSAIYLKDEKANTLYKAMDGIFNKYNNVGYKIKHISADNQFPILT